MTTLIWCNRGNASADHNLSLARDDYYGVGSEAVGMIQVANRRNDVDVFLATEDDSEDSGVLHDLEMFMLLLRNNVITPSIQGDYWPEGIEGIGEGYDVYALEYKEKGMTVFWIDNTDPQ